MSYGKGRKATGEFLNNIIAQQHFSVLEHANWTFIITGVSRTFTHELVRHRHFSFSQLSQRYVDHSACNFVMPAGIADTPLAAVWLDLMRASREFYCTVTKHLQEDSAEGATHAIKELRTIARSVLPSSVETKIVVTGNARTWREFLQKRRVAAADPEIRQVANMVYAALMTEAPHMFGDLDV